MPTTAPSFTYDVALSCVEHDRRVLDRMTERLDSRLSMSSSSGRLWTSPVDPDDDATTRALGADARVAVVLHQRLWGHTPATRRDAEAIRARLAESDEQVVLVVSLDDAPPPDWLGAADSRIVVDGDLDSFVEVIVAAVKERGGAALGPIPDDRAERASLTERAERERETYLGSYRATSALDREFERLGDEVARRAIALGAARDGTTPEIERAPGRCTVQVGPIALSLSWIRSRPDSVADGRLLIIEWEGMIGRRAAGAGHRPRELREDVFRANATRPEDWYWCAEGSVAREYGTRELAALCIESLACTLREREA